MNVNENHSDTVANSRENINKFPLMKPLVLLRDMNFVKDIVFSKGGLKQAVNSLSLFQANETTQKSFKVDLWHILGV